ncbi:arginase family protein [Blastococcus mobilis]|uniref:Arginase family protein n=1 Tax=Blastococcus mobilis TaxID=1938746 RepID=A0A238Z697_9ACTN|nr:arginase family protein [Blastococcus mobilis]SNR78936.1 Arginase family protein [Blastococcus mobilis]
MPESSPDAPPVRLLELHRLVAEAVAEARAGGEVPLLLAGNCNATVGVLAGLQPAERRVGLLGLDAHGDFNTPEEDSAGFLDGQGLAMAVGRCWRAATGRAPASGFRDARLLRPRPRPPRPHAGHRPGAARDARRGGRPGPVRPRGLGRVSPILTGGFGRPGVCAIVTI